MHSRMSRLCLALIAVGSVAVTASPAAGDVPIQRHVDFVDGVSMGQTYGAAPMAVDRRGAVHVLAETHYYNRQPGARTFSRSTITNNSAYEREMFVVPTMSGTSLDFFNNTCDGIKTFRVPATQTHLPDPTKAHVSIPVDCDHKKSWHDWWGIRQRGIVSLANGKDAIMFPDDPSNQRNDHSTVWFGSPGKRFTKTELPFGDDLYAFIARDPADGQPYVARTTGDTYGRNFTLHLYTLDASGRSWGESTSPLTGDPGTFGMNLQSMAVSHGQIWITALSFGESDTHYIGGFIKVIHRGADGTWDSLSSLPGDNERHHYTSQLVASPNASAADVWEVHDTSTGIARQEFTDAGGWGAPKTITRPGLYVDQIAATRNGPPVVEYTAFQLIN